MSTPNEFRDQVEDIASETADRVRALWENSRGVKEFALDLNLMTRESMGRSLGALMPIPSAVLGSAMIGPDGSMHLLLYANILEGADAQGTINNFVEMVKPILAKAPFEASVVVEGEPSEAHFRGQVAEA